MLDFTKDTLATSDCLARVVANRAKFGVGLPDDSGGRRRWVCRAGRLRERTPSDRRGGAGGTVWRARGRRPHRSGAGVTNMLAGCSGPH
jgi:hypothetical protein